MILIILVLVPFWLSLYTFPPPPLSPFPCIGIISLDELELLS